mmetsp:Transcript_178544/g.572235  ORF Transcript_178544/g.572235 Transcript_178544/m.572235 type:complete len:238 (+) Transcript_178544:2516-3229(+)
MMLFLLLPHLAASRPGFVGGVAGPELLKLRQVGAFLCGSWKIYVPLQLPHGVRRGRGHLEDVGDVAVLGGDARTADAEAALGEDHADVGEEPRLIDTFELQVISQLPPRGRQGEFVPGDGRGGALPEGGDAEEVRVHAQPLRGRFQSSSHSRRAVLRLVVRTLRRGRRATRGTTDVDAVVAAERGNLELAAPLRGVGPVGGARRSKDEAVVDVVSDHRDVGGVDVDAVPHEKLHKDE